MVQLETILMGANAKIKTFFNNSLKGNICIIMILAKCQIKRVVKWSEEIKRQIKRLSSVVRKQYYDC